MQKAKNSIAFFLMEAMLFLLLSGCANTTNEHNIVGESENTITEYHAERIAIPGNIEIAKKFCTSDEFIFVLGKSLENNVIARMNINTRAWECLDGLDLRTEALDISCYDNELWLLVKNEDGTYCVICASNSALSEATPLKLDPNNQILGMYMYAEGLLLWTNKELYLCDPLSGTVVKEKALTSTWNLNEISVCGNELYAQINKNGENGLIKINDIFSGSSIFLPLHKKAAISPLCVSSHDYLLISEVEALMLYDINSSSYCKLFSWADVGCAMPDLIPAVVEYSDETIYCLDIYTGYLLHIQPQIVPERTTIVLATSFSNSILNNIVYQFNQENEQYKVEIRMYGKNDVDRLRTEIIAGAGPDIIDTVSLPLPGEVNGYYENLLPFIENDTEISQNDFIPSIFEASKINGSIYYIMPSFDIKTIVARGAHDDKRVSFAEYLEVYMSENEENKMGGFANDVLQNAFPIIQRDIITANENGVTVNKQLLGEWLVFCTKAPSLNLSFETISNCLRSAAIATNIGDEVSFVGWPGQTNNGSYATPSYMCFAMLSTCEHKEAAWSFMRQVLSPVYQDNVAPFGFPVMTSSFERLLAETIEDKDIMFFKEDAEKLINLVSSLDVVSFYDDTLKELVSAGANDFFSGNKSLDDALTIIESKVNLYLAERY